MVEGIVLRGERMDEFFYIKKIARGDIRTGAIVVGGSGGLVSCQFVTIAETS